MLDQYDGEILFNDHHVGRLLDGLRAQGVLQDAIIIVTSDHGEEFFEHGQIGHGKSLYDEVLRVPFMVRWPGRIAPATHEQTGGPHRRDAYAARPPQDRPRPEMQGVSFAADLTGIPRSARRERKFFAQVVTDTLLHGDGPRSAVQAHPPSPRSADGRRRRSTTS